VNANNQLMLAKSYDPFGNTISSMGSDSSIFNYAGQQTDTSGLQYLRARYYDPSAGRFVGRDTWQGDSYQPISYNLWAYANANPVLYTDPTGQISVDEAGAADQIVTNLLQTYDITIEKDWGLVPIPVPLPPLTPENYSNANCGWNPGYWRSLTELNTVVDVAERYSEEAGGNGAARQILGGVRIKRTPTGGTETFRGTITIADYVFDQPGASSVLQKEWGSKVAIVHEFAHYWDWKTGNSLSQMLNLPGAIVTGMSKAIEDEPGPTWYARTSIVEDWAESVTGYLYPVYFEWLRFDPREWRTLPDGTKLPPGLGPLHETYVKEQFHH
jgi:RHS repeat-associated protein